MYENKEKPIVAVIERHDDPKGIILFTRDTEPGRKDDSFFEMGNVEHKIPYDRNKISFRFFWESRIQVTRDYVKISDTYKIIK